MIEINQPVWLVALDRHGHIVGGVCVDRYPIADSVFRYVILTANQTRATYEEKNVFSSLAAAQEAFEKKVAESQERSEAFAATFEFDTPTIGDEALDQFIESVWMHGRQVAASDEGYGDYPLKTDGDKIRQTARELAAARAIAKDALEWREIVDPKARCEHDLAVACDALLELQRGEK